MKIKNILAILSLGMVSCVGLEQYPTTSYTDETFWTIEDNVRTALYLGYNQCWHQDYYFANNLLSDDVYGSRHSTNETSIVTGMANTSNGRFSDEWDKCYQELRTIHTALDAQDRMNIDETFKTRMLAELRLMRAFTYLRLVTWFGDVPFFTTNPTLPESRVVKVTPAATIKEFIHSELAEVAEILPKNTDIPESENGRYTRGTAVALNARAYLYDNDFENCAIWCDKLINSTEYGTYALEQDYKKLFHDQSCCYGPESIMTIEFATLGGKLKNSRIITQHGVFDYLARDMGLDVVAVIQADDTQAPSASDMMKLIKAIRSQHVGAIFTEPQYPDKVAATLSRETGIATAKLDPVATGPAIAPLDYYEKTMRANLHTLESTLGTN